ncbi:MAG: hypothetical protein DCC75_04455 [Proteobacteria bacterium]|nr:MAG: hypothetical protein DCC75_04455 [Pseudomonadota bacterium]
MHRPILHLVLLSILVCLSWARAEQLIKVGVITDLSGPATFYGQGTRLGVQLAERELNSAGKQVKVIFEDSALNTQRGLSAAQKLLFIDKVDALMVDFTVIAVAVSKVAENNKTLLLYSAAAESVARSNPYAFKSYSDYSLGCEALAKEFLKRGVQKIGLLKAEAEYGELCEAGLRKVEIEVFEAIYRQGDIVSTQVLAMKRQGVGAIINAGFEGDMINTLRAANTLDFRVPVGGTEDSFSKVLLEQFKGRLEGSILFGSRPGSPDLLARFNKLNNSKDSPSYQAAILGYLHARQIFRAIESCAERKIGCIVSAMLASRPEPELGFFGWKNKIARLEAVVSEYGKGGFKAVGSYIEDEG